MKRVTLEDVAREYLRDQGCDLRDTLLLSHFVNKAKHALAEPQADNVEELGVVDREKGMRLVRG